MLFSRRVSLRANNEPDSQSEASMILEGGDSERPMTQILYPEEMIVKTNFSIDL